MLPRLPVTCACGDHVFAPLTKGFVALVSPEDGPLLAEPWYASTPKSGRVYPAREIKGRIKLLHCVVLPGVVIVDHRKGCGTDCRRPNLRGATASQNAMNRRGRNGAKGVWWEPSHRLWRAQVMVRGQIVWRERFIRKEQAEKAYARKIEEHHGEFACSQAGRSS